jgi:hypothetical protein
MECELLDRQTLHAINTLTMKAALPPFPESVERAVRTVS